MKIVPIAIVCYIYVLLIILVVVGEVKCIIKAINCNWEPVGKAEIIYTASALTGLGTIVGYMDIKDK
jgi:hypothetical protein